MSPDQRRDLGQPAELSEEEDEERMRQEERETYGNGDQYDPEMVGGPFRFGNQLWKRRKVTGAPRKFTHPQQLWEAAARYFQWVEDNPLMVRANNWYQGNVSSVNEYKMRPMSLKSMLVYINVNEQTWRDWRLLREDLLSTMELIESVIWSQKFEGAAAGLMNPMIIAREIGLKDSQDHTSSDGSMTPSKGATVEELSNEARRLGLDPKALGLDQEQTTADDVGYRRSPD